MPHTGFGGRAGDEVPDGDDVADRHVPDRHLGRFDSGGNGLQFVRFDLGKREDRSPECLLRGDEVDEQRLVLTDHVVGQGHHEGFAVDVVPRPEHGLARPGVGVGPREVSPRERRGAPHGRQL